MNIFSAPGITLSARSEACAPFQPIVWTGGTKPARYSAVCAQEKRLCGVFFREQCADYFTGWLERPNIDTMRIFWNRARHHAHATMRAHNRLT